MALKKNKCPNSIIGLSIILIIILVYFNYQLDGDIEGNMLFMRYADDASNSSNATDGSTSISLSPTKPPTTLKITSIPTKSPSKSPSRSPSRLPSNSPSKSPSISVSQIATKAPTAPNMLNLSNIEQLVIPGANKNRTLYVMNIIYLKYDQMLSIHLLGSSWWSAKDPTLYNIITDWHNYTKANNVEILCLFSYESAILVTKVKIVPEILLSQHGKSTVTLLCDIPTEIQQIHRTNYSQSFYEFVLFTSDNLTLVRLQYDIRKKSILPVDTKYNDTMSTKPRFLSLCIPSIQEPLPFITENIAYYISQGVQHIYLGTYFTVKCVIK